MNDKQKTIRVSTIGVAMISAFLTLACCWGPTLLTGVAVLSGVATNLSRLHPYEPWLFGISFISLGYNFYKTYRPNADTNETCKRCTSEGSPTVVSAGKYSKFYLWVATAFVISLFLVKMFPEIIL